MFDPRLLVGYDSSDDACVYSVSDDVAVIETVDFFTPIVDDPYLFGQIAAANALSDVYAMGGVPKLAMNLLCVPSCLPLDTVRAILEGGHDKAVEAGCVIAGGHTIQDDEPKYGLCVTGFVHPQHILKNIGAQPGDVLVLTKALGVGVITTALKAALADDSARDAAYASMAALNAKAAQAVREVENVHACTDVTGFGLLGHSYEMASGSGVTVRLHGAALPLLPQAGVALGMCVSAQALGAADGLLVRNIVLFSVLIYELVGPLLTKEALTAAGEITAKPREVLERRAKALAEAEPKEFLEEREAKKHKKQDL